MLIQFQFHFTEHSVGRLTMKSCKLLPCQIFGSKIMMHIKVRFFLIVYSLRINSLYMPAVRPVLCSKSISKFPPHCLYLNAYSGLMEQFNITRRDNYPPFLQKAESSMKTGCLSKAQVAADLRLSNPVNLNG